MTARAGDTEMSQTRESRDVNFKTREHRELGNQLAIGNEPYPPERWLSSVRDHEIKGLWD